VLVAIRYAGQDGSLDSILTCILDGH